MTYLRQHIGESFSLKRTFMTKVRQYQRANPECPTVLCINYVLTMRIRVIEINGYFDLHTYVTYLRQHIDISFSLKRTTVRQC